MTVQNRKKRERDMRKEAILDAAEELVIQKGFDDVKMEEIAAAAELSKGTLYLYFRNKIEIAVALHIRGFKSLHEQLASVITSQGTGLDILREMSRVFFQFAQTHPHYFKFVIYIESIGIKALKEIKETETMEEAKKLDEGLYNFIKRAVQIGIQDGSIDPVFEPDKIALQVLSASRGLILHIVFKEEGMMMFPVENVSELTLESLLEDYFTMLTRALRPEK